ncbi:MAG TPA: hypothetical protein VLH79_16320 [Chthonomonadales bacterium]|nr:hypothetical protein [Chthonomonadales bacterium]
MRSLARMVWFAVAPLVRVWLAGRALVLPAARREEVARSLGIETEMVLACETALREWALGEFDRFRP